MAYASIKNNLRANVMTSYYNVNQKAYLVGLHTFVKVRKKAEAAFFYYFCVVIKAV